MIFCIALTAMVISTTLSPALPAAYQMEARLDTAEHKIYAAERIAFLNPTMDTLNQISFHLYPNAFRDTSSIYARKDLNARQNIFSGNRADLKVSKIMLDGILVDSSKITESGTLLYVSLPRPLPPDDSILIALDFELLIPKHIMRIGYNEKGNYLISHWHPILCGYQNGRLIDNEYYPQSEFFSNFASYDVTLKIPSGFAVGATGELSLVAEDSNRAVWHAKADTVIDFAFACGPAFELFESDTLGIKINYLLEKENAKFQTSTDNAVKYSLAYCSERLFKYPYRTFTLVDFDMGAQGMELPGMNVISFPEGRIISGARPILWFVIAHEAAHEWFYGTVATNEAEEPWLDEAFATYWASRIMEAQQDSLKYISIFGYRAPINTLDHILALMGKAEWPVNLKSWDYPDDFSYSTAVYFRASAVLQTLEQMLGRAAFDSALGIYANRFRFKHPAERDFYDSIEKSARFDLDPFFAQFIAGTARVDYAIRNIEYNSNAEPNETYSIKVTAGREFDGILPHRIEIGLENGAILDTHWDGAARTAIFEFTANSKPEYAKIGFGETPYALDENLGNNSMYLKSFGWRMLNFEWDAVFALEFFISLLL